jgi:transcriptional regulator with XRE-family HTH domain/tetratricopeptide (TPR) repeat protein
MGVRRFSLLLRDWRVARLLTQEELAKRSGVSVRTIRNFEAGRALRPHLNSVRALADALGLTGEHRSEFVAAAPGGEPEPVPAPGQRPRQLPAPPGWFTGRVDEFAELDKALLADAGEALAITTVGGVGGIGKTAFALCWAHRNAYRFPDGQLFVNLRGFDPMVEPLAPSAALRLLLEGMGVSAASMPSDVDALGALWRGVLADKRVLIVLDNARDSAQVEPLLPGTPSGAVLVTSRHQLPGLITTHGALPLRLDGLGEADATDLVRGRLGADRCAAESGAVAELVRRCAGLPLALNIVAARAVAGPSIPLAALASELGHQTSRLDALDAGEISADLRTVFAVSCNALSGEAAALFELLGVAPGPDTSLLAAAALFGESVARARAALVELGNAHLVIRQHDRYRMHDLVRLYAAERAQARETRDEALFRVVEHYAYTAHLTDQPHHNAPVALVPHSHEPQVRQFADTAEALAWFDDERLCVLAAQRLAVDRGWDRLAWHLAWSLDRFLYWRGALADHLTCWHNGLTAAERLGDALLLALAHRGIGIGLSRAGQLAEGLEYLLRALDLADQTGDHLTQARIHRSLAWTRAKQGDIEQAAEHARQAVRLYQLIGVEPALLASGLNAEGWYEARLGNYDRARERCEAALVLAREHHHRELEAGTLDSLGYIAQHTGDLTLAVTYFRQAIETYRQLGTTYGEADTLRRLGDTHQAAGDPVQAREAWASAETLYIAQSRTTEAADVRDKIDDQQRPASPE